MFYTDKISAKEKPSTFFCGEKPLELTGAYACIPEDYDKKKFVFRLK